MQRLSFHRSLRQNRIGRARRLLALRCLLLGTAVTTVSLSGAAAGTVQASAIWG